MSSRQLCGCEVEFANDIMDLVSTLQMTSFGTSTGGEQALRAVLYGLEKDIKAKTRAVRLVTNGASAGNRFG